MSKPSEEELQLAMQEAMRMREQGEDPHFLAKSLLNCRFQYTYLEQVLHAAENYLNSGLGEREHSILLKAIEKARQVDERSAKREHRDFGLL